MQIEQIHLPSPTPTVIPTSTPTQAPTQSPPTLEDILAIVTRADIKPTTRLLWIYLLYHPRKPWAKSMIEDLSKALGINPATVYSCQRELRYKEGQV
jgi:hypothetical protein